MLDERSTRIVNLLKSKGIEFEEFHHSPARTCEEAARLRGTDLSESGKTMLLKAKTGFVMASLAGNLAADNQKLRHALKSNKLRFATEEELSEVLGYPRGGIPPIGRPLHNIDLYLDQSLLNKDYIAFTAGSLTYSIRLSISSYLDVVDARTVLFAK